MSDLQSLRQHLEVLNLNVTRAPTMKEYKKAYRDLMRLHPDLGGDTSKFQEITLAAREVFKYIRTHPNEAGKSVSESDSDLLKAFEASNTVNYNTGNIVFEIEATDSSLWVECLTKRLGKPLPLDNDSFQFKIEEFKLPRMNANTKTNYGSVTVTIWPKPKTTHPKVMVQGKCHLAFVTFVVPLILKDIKAVRKLPTLTASANLELAESSDDEAHEPAKKDTEVVSKALGRLEKEVVNMRDDMAERIEAALQGRAAPDNSHLEKKLDSIENLLKENIEQHSKLAASIDGLRDTLANSDKVSNVKLDSGQLEQLARDITSSQSSQVTALSTTVSAIRSEMAQAASLTSVQTQVDTMNSVLDQVHSVSLKIDHNLHEVRKDVTNASDSTSTEMTQLRKNSDNSLKMFESMATSLKNIEANASKTFPTNPPTPNSTSHTPTVSEIPVRKGIMFTSSIALDTDTKRYKDELNCELKVIPTYYAEENPSARDPDAYLGCMVNQHLRGKSGYHFAIFATGTNDITDLDTENSPTTTLFSKVSSQSKTIFDVAESLTKELDIDVFVVDKPPRYDTTADPTGMKQKLTKNSNGVLASTTGATPRIFLVEQTSLGRSAGKGRTDIFQKDGLHLTPKGINFYNTNIVNVMRECYPDTQLLQQASRGQGNHKGVEEGRDRGQGVHGQDGDRGQRGDRGRGNDRDQHHQGRGGNGRPGKNHRGGNQHGGDQWNYPPGRGGQRGGGGWGRDDYWDYPGHRGFGGGYNRGGRY